MTFFAAISTLASVRVEPFNVVVTANNDGQRIIHFGTPLRTMLLTLPILKPARTRLVPSIFVGSLSFEQYCRRWAAIRFESDGYADFDVRNRGG